MSEVELKRALPSITDFRNYGLDILKILSMIYVVILHTVGMGGIIQNSSGLIRLVAIGLFFISSVAVNNFTIVSGYLSYTDIPKPLNRKRLIELWFQAFFYGVMITTICFLLFPGNLSTTDFFISGFPLFSDEYWYFTSYFLVSLLSPFINSAIRNQSETSLRKTFLVLVFFFSFFLVFSNSKSVVQSYTFIWILLIYIMGAIMSKAHIAEKISPIALIGIIVICNIINFSWFIWIDRIDVLRSSWDGFMFSEYFSPTMLIQSMCYLMLFRRIQINGRVKYFIRNISQCVFATYLINTHHVFFGQILNGAFVYLTEMNCWTMVSYVLFFSILFVAVSCILDKGRMLLFRLIRLDKLILVIADCVDKIFTLISKRI